MAFDRGDAPDRLPDGLGVVEAVARRGAADRRRGEISKLRFDDGGDDMLCIPPGAEGARYARTRSPT